MMPSLRPAMGGSFRRGVRQGTWRGDLHYLPTFVYLRDCYLCYSNPYRYSILMEGSSSSRITIMLSDSAHDNGGFNQHYLDSVFRLSSEISSKDIGCVPAFIFDIVPGRTEKVVLRSSWVLIFTGLLCIMKIQGRSNWPLLRR